MGQFVATVIFLALFVLALGAVGMVLWGLAEVIREPFRRKR